MIDVSNTISNTVSNTLRSNKKIHSFNSQPNCFQREGSYNTDYEQNLIERMSDFCFQRLQCRPCEELALAKDGNKYDGRKLTISDNEIHEVPPFYPLELTHKVLLNTTAKTVSERLSECIKAHSLATQWNSDTPTQLRCSTNGFLDLEINVWKRSNGVHDKVPFEKIDERVYDVIIEIRRLDGNCVHFHRLRNSLFDIILRIEQGPICNQDENKHIMQPKVSHLRPLAIDNLMDILNSAMMAFKLMSNEIHSDKILGLSMMIFLTDSAIVHPVYAGHISDLILLGYDLFGNEYPELKDAIFKLVVYQKENEVAHQYALQILTNAFQNCSLQYDIPMEIHPEIEIWNSVINSLIIDMDNVETNPHVAYNAMKCLRGWFILSGDQANSSHKQRILDMVDKTRAYGQQRYLSLEEESFNLTMSMI